MTAASTKSMLRSILRLVRTPELPEHLAKKELIVPLGHFNPTQAKIMEHFRHGSADVEPLANNYLKLLQDLKERARLHALDAGADTVLSPKEMTRRAAARAGLQPPKLDPNLK